uniref:V-type proton ATPase subunit G n=1 Tax=Haemonchus contortus TaxID=6289 RepID=A0A7I4Z1D5_HAECO
MVLSTAHFDARHAYCGRDSAKLKCALYFSGPGPPIPHLTRSLQADLKELRNFVTDIQTDRQNDRRSALYNSKQDNSGKLETLITRFKAEGLETVKLPDAEEEISHVTARGKLQRLEGVGATERTTSKIEQKLKDYAEAMDSVAEPSPKDVEALEMYPS